MGISRPFPGLPVRLSTLVSRAPKATKFKIGYDSDGTPRQCFLVVIELIIFKLKKTTTTYGGTVHAPQNFL